MGAGQFGVRRGPLLAFQHANQLGFGHLLEILHGESRARLVWVEMSCERQKRESFWQNPQSPMSDFRFYSYREQENPDTANSALHMIATDVLISYRFERSSRSWVKPYVGVGPGVNIVIQRGIDELNTSEAKGVLVGAIGVGFNVKRLFDLSSPLDWELNAQYKRWFDSSPSNVDYNGQTVSLGFSMIL